MSRKILKALVGLFILRLILAFIVWHPDLNNHIDWGIRFFEYGPGKFYSANVWSFTWPNQPPGTMYLFAGMRKLFEMTFNFFWFLNVKIPVFPSGIITYFEKTLYPFFLQLPAIVADFGIAWLIYRFIVDFTKRKDKKDLAILGALIFLINPIVWYNSSVWGQYDSVVNFLGLFSFYLLLKKRLLLSVVVFALSVFTKASLLIFAPIYLLVAIKQKYKISGYVFSGIAALLVIGLLTLPFSQGEPFEYLYYLYKDKIFTQQLQVITANAFNIWAAISGIHEKPHELLLGPVSYKAWGTLLYAVSYLPALYLVYKKQNLKSIIWSLAIVAFSTFMLLTNMHERYLYPLFAPLTILVVTGGVNTVVYWTISIISLFNLYNFWFTPRLEVVVNLLSAGDRFLPRVLGAFNFGLFLYIYKRFLRLFKASKI